VRLSLLDHRIFLLAVNDDAYHRIAEPMLSRFTVPDFSPTRWS
jgi:hypothetical protein